METDILMKKLVTYIDIPSGWMWGFSKALPEPRPENMRQWLLDSGCPEKDVDFAMKYCRMWQEEE